MEHIEAAGIHSGDSACVFPPFKTDPAILVELQEQTRRMALEAGIKGLINVQYAAKDGVLYVLEVNPRASRTIPFISKASGVNLVEAAVRVWEGARLEDLGLRGTGTCKTGWAVKEAVFSFGRLPDSDPMLGPEMKSTGEVIGTGDSFGEAFAKAQASAGSPLPTSGRVFVSVNRNDRVTILPTVRALASMGFELAATRGTAQFLFENGLFPDVVLKMHEGRPNVVDHLQERPHRPAHQHAAREGVAGDRRDDPHRGRPAQGAVHDHDLRGMGSGRRDQVPQAGRARRAPSRRRGVDRRGACARRARMRRRAPMPAFNLLS